MGPRSQIPNLVVAGRTVLVLGCLALLRAPGFGLRLTGVWLLALAAVLDGVDGYLARRLDSVSSIGAKLDTLGDRVTENVLFIFLAVEGVVPLFVPVVFVTRSFLSDFLRSLHDRRGVAGTFAMNTSVLGHALVASKTSRVAYLLLKFAVFLVGGFYLALCAKDSPQGMCALAEPLRSGAWWGAIGATLVNLVRFGALCLDSREVLKEELGL